MQKIKWDAEKAKEYLCTLGYEMLDNIFVNVRTPILIKTQEGYITSISINNARIGQGVFLFSPKNPYVLYNIQHFLNIHSKGTKLLSDIFVSNSVPIKFQCPCGETFKRTWGNVYNLSQFYCNRCALERRVGLRRKNFDDVQKLFVANNLILLDDCYINNSTPLNCITQEGYLVSISYNNLSKGKYPSIFAPNMNSKYFVYNIKKYLEDSDLNCEFIELCADNKHLLCKCYCGNLFVTTTNCLLKKQQYRCKKCSQKQSVLENKIENWLKLHNITFYMQYCFEGCKDKRDLPFDFYLPKYNMCIESDGPQHTNKNSRFYSEDTIRHDIIKNNYCQQHNINLLRISYEKFNTQEYIDILTTNILQA